MKLDTILNGALAAAGLAMLGLLLIPALPHLAEEKQLLPKPKKKGKGKKEKGKKKKKDKKLYQVMKTNDGWKVQLDGIEQSIIGGNLKKNSEEKAKKTKKSDSDSQPVIYNTSDLVRNGKSKAAKKNNTDDSPSHQSNE